VSHDLEGRARGPWRIGDRLAWLGLVATIVVQGCGPAPSSGSGPHGGAAPGAPTEVVASALPYGFKVSFATPSDNGSPILAYAAVSPEQTWLSSWAGSWHIQRESPLFVQGGCRGPVGFIVYAYSANGWSAASSESSLVTSPCTVPSVGTDPYWIYFGGVYRWNGDFSQPSGGLDAAPPAHGGGGGALDQSAVEIDWFSTDVAPPVSDPGGTVVKVADAAGVGTGFLPSITGLTMDPTGYRLLVMCLYPTYPEADFSVHFETANDATASDTLDLAAYNGGRPLAQGAWTCLNIPLTDLHIGSYNAGADTVYKMLLFQGSGTQGTWYLDALGFANEPHGP
jgi:hypothetical protein